jgi:cobalt/nickel transport system permease protein
MSANSRGVIERSLSSFVDALQHAYNAEKSTKKKGLLQKLDPRVKILAILPLIVIAALTRRLRVVIVLFGIAAAIALLSKVPLITLAKRVWLAVLTFTGFISVPALFLTPGRAIYSLPLLGWSVTAPGLRAAAYLISAPDRCNVLRRSSFCAPWSNDQPGTPRAPDAGHAGGDFRHDLPLHFSLLRLTAPRSRRAG